MEGLVAVSWVLLIDFSFTSALILLITAFVFSIYGLFQGIWWRRRLMQNRLVLHPDRLQICKGGEVAVSINRSEVRTIDVIGKFDSISILKNQGAEDFPHVRIGSDSVIYTPPILWWGSDATEAQRALSKWLNK